MSSKLVAIQCDTSSQCYAGELVVHATLGWAIKQELLGVTLQARALTHEQQRIQALESEVKQLRRDNDLLKKASVLFAIEMQASNKSSHSN